MRVAYVFVIADLLHYGHLQLLEAAKSVADVLVCGVLTDEAVAAFQAQPISSYAERSAVVQAVRFVDEVVPQDSQDPVNNVRALRQRFPEADIVFVHGDQWARVPGVDALKAMGVGVLAQKFYDKLSNERIVQKTVEGALGAGSALDTFTTGFATRNFKVFRKRPPQVVLASKAKTLQALKPLLSASRIEKTYVFTVANWDQYSADILRDIRREFPTGRVVVRSSCQAEDSRLTSNAGRFRSVLGVSPRKAADLSRAISNVVESYGKSTCALVQDQVLVQQQTESLQVCGVILTAELKTNAPYYIINYDDTGSADAVTSGTCGKLLKIFRTTPASALESPWDKVLAAVREIEEIVTEYHLDIEFAVDGRGEVVVFQVRPLAANIGLEMPGEKDVEILVKGAERHYRKLKTNTNLSPGERPVFSDMLFWNPAELIGHSPSPLASSLFKRLIMDKAWNQGLLALGYPSVFPHPLMERFLYKPYINVNTAFRALVPTCVPERFRQRLQEYFLAKLMANPSLHDKAEFEIMFSCHDFQVPKRLRELEEHGFIRGEVEELEQVLAGFTAQLLRRADDIRKTLADQVGELERFNALPLEAHLERMRGERSLYGVSEMLEQCERHGTVPFSTAARLAFIAGAFMRSLASAGVISQEERELVMNTFSSVATQMAEDTQLAASGRMPFADYLEKYGHLRAGTYDITRRRYAEIVTPEALGQPQEPRCVELPAELRRRIDKAARSSALGLSFEALHTFAGTFIHAREYYKFVFTRTLSNALEVIKAAGALQGFVPADLAHMDLETAFTLFSQRPEVLAQRVEVARASQERYAVLALPPLIFSEADFRVQRFMAAKPNFITTRMVAGPVVVLENGAAAMDLAGKIVFIENADPGYHWIFARGIGGLVTKYGGAASHMAICCAEFDIPAAIGCGELYDRLRLHETVRLNCRNHTLN